MRKMRKEDIGLGKMMAACALGAAVLCLVSCGAGSEPGKSAGAETPEGEITEDAGEITAIEETGGIVEGVQLVKGYGIFTPGQAPVYTMKEEPAAIQTDGAEAWLLSSFYQDGVFLFLVKVEDYSITVIPPQEAKTLPGLGEEEREYQNRQGESLWYPDYFPIEKEHGIYGRSEFEVRANYRSSGKGVQEEKLREHFGKSLTGAGIPGGSFSLEMVKSIRDYREYVRSGSVTTYFCYQAKDRKLDSSGPKGSYQLTIPGFEDGFSFEFMKAPSYPKASDIPGMVIKQGVGIMAAGKRTENELAVTTYIWSDGTDGTYVNGITPTVSGLVCESGGKTGYGICLRRQSNQNFYNWPPEFSGKLEGKEWLTFFYEIPELYKEGEFFLECSKVSLSFNDQSQWVTIPIPEEKAELNQTAELGGCTISFLSAEKQDELRTFGRLESGEEDKRPCVFLSVRADIKGDRYMQLNNVQSVQEEEDPQNPIRGRAHAVYTNNRLSGIYAYYEEGDEELRIRFKSPFYEWYEKFRVKIEI